MKNDPYIPTPTGYTPQLPPIPQLPQTEMASYAARLGAYTIDWIFSIFIFEILNAFFGFACAPILYALNLGANSDQTKIIGNLLGIFVAILSLFVVIIIFAAQESGNGSLGKRTVGILVADVNGNKIGFVRSLLRVLARGISVLCTCGLAALSVFFTANRQGIHDMLLSTQVIKRKVYQIS